LAKNPVKEYMQLTTVQFTINDRNYKNRTKVADRQELCLLTQLSNLPDYGVQAIVF
jgi:hypothetical protein